jgi:CRISPR/Cas system CSM-associated protein Csm5 (group 7 of RAMP superfamily)
LQNYTYNIELKSPVHIGIGDTPPNLLRFIQSNGRPFIPGSEVKGAIRSAILYIILKNDKKLLGKLKADLNCIITMNLSSQLNDYKKAQDDVKKIGGLLGKIKRDCINSKCNDLISLMQSNCTACISKNFKPVGSTTISSASQLVKNINSCVLVNPRKVLKCSNITTINIISNGIRGSLGSLLCNKCYVFSGKDIRTDYIKNHLIYFGPPKLTTNRDNKRKIWEQEKKNVSEKINKIIDDHEKSIFHVVPDDIKTSLFKYLIVTDSELFGNSHIHNYQENITPQSPNKIRKEYLWDNVTSNKIKIKIFDERISLLFQNDTAKEKLSESSIVRACKEFAVDKIDEEIAYFVSINSGVKSFYEQFKNEIIANKGNDIYLRIGGGQGLLSITLDLLLKDEPFFKPLIANLKENRVLSKDYPASRRIVMVNNNSMPPGWIKLTRQP